MRVGVCIGGHVGVVRHDDDNYDDDVEFEFELNFSVDKSPIDSILSSSNMCLSPCYLAVMCVSDGCGGGLSDAPHDLICDPLHVFVVSLLFMIMFALRFLLSILCDVPCTVSVLPVLLMSC